MQGNKKLRTKSQMKKIFIQKQRTEKSENEMNFNTSQVVSFTWQMMTLFQPCLL